MRRSLVAVPLALATLGCMGLLQSNAAGIQVICDAPLECETCQTAPPESRMVFFAAHISENLYNPDAIALMEAMAVAAREDRMVILRKAANSHGIQKCALADLMESSEREMWSLGIEEVCAFTDCASDPSDPQAVVTCAAAKSQVPEVGDALQELDTNSPQALAEGLQKLAAKHGQPACALSALLRNAR